MKQEIGSIYWWVLVMKNSIFDISAGGKFHSWPASGKLFWRDMMLKYFEEYIV